MRNKIFALASIPLGFFSFGCLIAAFFTIGKPPIYVETCIGAGLVSAFVGILFTRIANNWE